MIKPSDPRHLAEALLNRSICAVQVAAVIADRYGIFSWGHNHMGFDGMGAHAEAEAIRRANKKRLKGATIYVAGKRSKPLMSRPCKECEKLIIGYGITEVYYTDAFGWRREDII